MLHSIYHLICRPLDPSAKNTGIAAIWRLASHPRSLMAVFSNGQ
ncbi:hypothetical protein PATSB16_24110 [Pandoraea thiooxydans]|nr:hypothetical protein PATSB16_24110 [Pandoraea thiooxydans]